MVNGPFLPSAARWAGSQLSIFPLSQAECCTVHAWLVDGMAWALVVRVFRWNGSK
jgi:hypothetical protein